MTTPTESRVDDAVAALCRLTRERDQAWADLVRAWSPSSASAYNKACERLTAAQRTAGEALLAAVGEARGMILSKKEPGK